MSNQMGKPTEGWGTEEEGELISSVHNRSKSPNAINQSASIYVVRPDKNKFLQGICRPSDPSPSNYKLSDFENIHKIGEGTFGKVYRAEYRCDDGTIK